MAEEKEEKKEEGKKKKSPMLLIIIIVVVLAIAGAACFFLLGGKDKAEDAKEEPQEQVEEEAKLESYEFEPFTVNLAKVSNYLQTTILIEYDPSLYSRPQEEGGEVKEGEGTSNVKEIEKLFEKRNAMIRDAIISVLSYKTPEEVLPQEGKEQLKEELVDAINNALGLDDAIVVSVYFKDFIMQ